MTVPGSATYTNGQSFRNGQPYIPEAPRVTSPPSPRARLPYEQHRPAPGAPVEVRVTEGRGLTALRAITYVLCSLAACVVIAVAVAGYVKYRQLQDEVGQLGAPSVSRVAPPVAPVPLPPVAPSR